MFTDAHVHFDTFILQGEADAVLERAALAGVSRMIAIGGSVEANRRARDFARAHPGKIWATAGYDRDLAGTSPPLDVVRELVASAEVVAIGETGLDYHYAPESAIAQKELFCAMLSIARDAGKPVVIHSRDAEDDMAEILARQLGPKSGVLHCFTGSLDFARRMLDLGLMISFSGIVTFKSAEALREVARFVPGDRLLIETDAPYLAPVPHRGKTNEPAWVALVAAALASLRGDTIEHLAEQTTENAQRLFGLY